MAASTEAVLTAAIISIVTVLIGFAGFHLLKTWGKSSILYDSKVRRGRGEGGSEQKGRLGTATKQDKNQSTPSEKFTRPREFKREIVFATRFTRIHTHTHTHTNSHTLTHKLKLSQTQTHTHTQTRTHTHTHTHTHTFIQSHTHTHTYTHKRTHQ